MTPLLKLLDINLDIVTIIDDYETLYFEEKFADVGECKIEISADSENFKSIQKNMFIYLDKYRCWFIEDIDISEGKATLSCLALSFIFSHRIIIPPTDKSHLQVSNKLTGEIAKAFIDSCLVKSTDESRNIPLVFESYKVGHKAIYESRYENLLSELQVLATYSNFGFKVGIDIKNRNYVCSLYEGRDMTEEIIFSEEFDNIDDVKISDSNSGYKNTVYIAADGEGANRNIQKMAIGDYSGFMLREDIIEAQIDKETDEEGNEIPVDVANTIEITGLEFLEENCEKTSIEAILLNTVEEIEVGDIVTIKSKRYGLQLTQRIIEVNTEYTVENGKSIGIVVGTQKPTLTFVTEKNEIA